MSPNNDAANDVTSLLIDWNGGDEAALERLMRLTYEELHQLAAGFFRRERADHTLQPTALVNELYLRLLDQDRISWRNRAQFIGIAGQMMRRILVDHFRAKQAEKRGGELEKVTLEDVATPANGKSYDLIALDQALDRLHEVDPQEAKIVELRFFAGLTIEEAAVALDISPATVKRDWASAKAWLWRNLDHPSK